MIMQTVCAKIVNFWDITDNGLTGSVKHVKCIMSVLEKNQDLSILREIVVLIKF